MKRTIWTVLFTLLTIAPAHAARMVGSFTVDPAGVARTYSPITATLNMELPPGERFILLPDGPYGGPATILQVERGKGNVTLRWVERGLKADQSRKYGIFAVDGEKPMAPDFHFTDGDGVRDLYVGDTPLWRDMLKYDPADRENTYKVYKHVYGFNKDDGPVTKGPGGKYPHHRGVFFGFKTQFGDFWHCPDVTQRHVKYLDERQLLGQVVFRDAAVTEWVAKDEKPVVRDTREVTTWRASPTDVVMDFDITLEALTDEPITLGGDAHHAGFHFRAAQEVAEKDAGGKEGRAVYLRSENAKLSSNDIWDQCDWTHMAFPIKDHKYALTHFDAPTNPRPIQYSTRPYGRVGSFFVGKVAKEAPLRLHYRLRLRDGQEVISPEQLAVEYKDFSTPVKVSVTKAPSRTTPSPP